MLTHVVNHLYILQLLKGTGADPNVTINDLGMTPLELAVFEGNHQDAQILYPVTCISNSNIFRIEHWWHNEKFDRAVDAFSKGLKLAPENKELQNALQESIEAKMKSTTA
ncbi:hypothetical protein FRX31_021431 [Thalictrum thalictroides]|uniref:Uncharacterized protein n=1 Tax=Thalictrum thalictroides TaxID=46969 RepID=A0A7J6VXE5_THATH|nr:hypothetical protein FRX31_021431 [Thalictrum thalictroides]